MQIFTQSRKLRLAFHLGLIYLCYFTHRTVIRRFFPEIKDELKWIVVALYSLTILNYLVTCILNPGQVKIKNNPDLTLLGITDAGHIKQLQRTCDKCRGSWQPPRAKHCYQCNKCVFRYDHHSELFNNCIGINNQKPLIMTAICGALLAVLTLAINLTAFFIWTRQLKKTIFEGGFRITSTKIIVSSLVLISLTLALACLNWGVGQYFSIKDNQTSHEYEDGNLVGRPADFQTNYEQICGKWGWWIPLPASVNANYLELLYTKIYVSKNSYYVEDLFSVGSSQYYNEYQKYKLQ